MIRTSLQAPVSGWSLPLEEVPDPVFAQGMAGQGAAIDPTEACLYSPCDGEVVTVHRCLHALTLRTPGGLELLLHVGIDTVQLQGEGFRVHVEAGRQVRTGDLLLEFDADRIARRCRSLITVMLVPPTDRLESLEALTGQIQRGQPWLDLRLQAPARESSEPDSELWGEWLELPNPAGMHARPAARLVGLAREASPARVFLESESGRASAQSLVALLGLGLSCGDRVRLGGSGLRAEQLAHLEAEVRSGLGDDLQAPAPLPTPTPTVPGEVHGALVGVVASPGLAVGTVYLWSRPEFVLPEESRGVGEERSAFEAAVRQTREQLEQLAGAAPAGEAAIFQAHQELLGDPELLAQVEQALQSGVNAARAWQKACGEQAERLEKLSNPLLAERAQDLRDVGDRCLLNLLGCEAPKREFPAGCIVVARDLTPGDTLTLDPERVQGLCLARGGPTSHVAILARSLGLPSLCALGEACLDLAAGAPVILDTENGILVTVPTSEQLDAARERLEVQGARQRLEREQAHSEARTLDGLAVEVAVNVAGGADLSVGLEAGAEGVGLFRTELFFHEHPTEPSSEQQRELYSALARQLGPSRRLVARLLDVGGDKPLPYLQLPEEENPFLGMRGIRLFRSHPDLFRRQLENLLSVSGECRLALLVPMVSSLSEWRQVRAEIERLRGDRAVELGVMIEVPSAALLAEAFAPEVDFFSIGTNDLTQYTLALDRGHPQLAAQVDALHPAVLRLIERVGEAAGRHGRWVGVCGGAASELDAIPLLLGLGVTELSVSGPAVPAVKSEIRRWSFKDCEALARRALQLAEPSEIRSLVRQERRAAAEKGEA